MLTTSKLVHGTELAYHILVTGMNQYMISEELSMNYVSELLKGILIGIANIIPGVSGGTMAVSMGIYDTIIHAVTHLHKEPKESCKTLLPYGIGAFAGITGLSFAIEFLFLHYPLQTSLTFIGLILGGLPSILRKVPRKSIPASGYGAFFFMFLLVVGMTMLEGASGAPVDLSASPSQILPLFFIGTVAAATMVIPGVSGSMILMLLGYYQPIIASINRFIVSGATMDVAGVLTECAILVPFGLGVVTGIFLCAKLIELLLSHFQVPTYCAILGLVLSSPIVILAGISPASVTVSSIFSGLVCFAVSLLMVLKGSVSSHDSGSLA